LSNDSSSTEDDFGIKKKRLDWSHKETLHLISVLNEFKGVQRKFKHLTDDQLKGFHPDRSYTSIRDKLKSLSKSNRILSVDGVFILDSNQSTSTSRSDV